MLEELHITELPSGFYEGDVDPDYSGLPASQVDFEMQANEIAGHKTELKRAMRRLAQAQWPETKRQSLGNILFLLQTSIVQFEFVLKNGRNPKGREMLKSFPVDAFSHALEIVQGELNG